MKFQNVTGQQFFEAKSEDFFRAASDIGFCVFPRLDSPRSVSGNSQTMGGLPRPVKRCQHNF